MYTGRREIRKRERRVIPTSQYIIYPCGLLLPHGRQEKKRERERERIIVSFLNFILLASEERKYA